MREECLCVFWEVLAAVGRVEAFREDYEIGAGFGGLEDAGASTGEVVGFVGAWEGRLVAFQRPREHGEETCGELHEGELERFFEQVSHIRMSTESRKDRLASYYLGQL